HADSSYNSLTGLNRHIPFRPEHYIDTRAEFHQSDPLACFHDIAGFFVTNDAPRDEPGDLLEHHARLSAAHHAIDSDHVLLIRARRVLAAGNQELALLVGYAGNFARNRRAIHVDVEDIQKDTYALFIRFRFDGDDLAVR